MKLICINVCIIILMFQGLNGQSKLNQTLIQSKNLKTAFRQTQHDSITTRLRYESAVKNEDTSLVFWSALIMAAHHSHLPIYESKAYKYLGDIYYFRNQRLLALKAYDSSLSVLNNHDLYTELLHRLLQIIDKHIYYNNFKLALKEAYRGLQLSEWTKNKEWVANFEAKLGTIYFYTKEFDKALEKHLKALHIYESLNIKPQIVSALCDVGSDYSNKLDTLKSNFYYLRTKTYLNVLEPSIHTIEICKAITTAYIMDKKYDSANYYIQIAYRFSDSLKLEKSKVSVLFLLTLLNFNNGKNEKAKQYALAGLVLAKRIKFNFQIPQMADILKQIYLIEKNYPAAMAAYELFISTSDSLSNEKNRREVLQKQYEHDIEKTASTNRVLTQENQIQALKLQTNQYLLISLLIFLGLAILIAYLFIRQNKLKSIQQNMILEQRLRRLQMNPHFIFNALQAIQNFILKNESRLAIKYMSAFASITRHVLENSRLEYITIKKELLLIENYLQLQSMRFVNRFEYLIDIDEAIDIDSVVIPPMLSQPFIENAVEHGLKGVTDNGKIWIIFQLLDHQLFIKIIDNGFGMHAQNSANLPHQSLAIEITKERIALMNKKEKTTASFEIEEAFPLENERKGVRVNLRLPIMQ